MVIVLGEREERFSEADTQDLGIWDSTYQEAGCGDIIYSIT